jgi:large subunit ribosomal protein L24
MSAKFKIKKGDRVVVITGRDKGRTGDVLKVLRDRDRLIVQGVNMMKRHTKQTPGQTGGIVDREGSIHVSNVAIADPKGGGASRIGYKFLDDGRKVRVARRSGEVIDR